MSLRLDFAHYSQEPMYTHFNLSPNISALLWLIFMPLGLLMFSVIQLPCGHHKVDLNLNR